MQSTRALKGFFLSFSDFTIRHVDYKVNWIDLAGLPLLSVHVLDEICLSVHQMYLI